MEECFWYFDFDLCSILDNFQCANFINLEEVSDNIPQHAIPSNFSHFIRSDPWIHLIPSSLSLFLLYLSLSLFSLFFLPLSLFFSLSHYRKLSRFILPIRNKIDVEMEKMGQKPKKVRIHSQKIKRRWKKRKNPFWRASSRITHWIWMMRSADGRERDIHGRWKCYIC